MQVSHVGHKERELELECSNGEDLGISFCPKIKKLLDEHFPSQVENRTWCIGTASDGPKTM